MFRNRGSVFFDDVLELADAQRSQFREGHAIHRSGCVTEDVGAVQPIVDALLQRNGRRTGSSLAIGHGEGEVLRDLANDGRGNLLIENDGPRSRVIRVRGRRGYDLRKTGRAERYVGGSRRGCHAHVVDETQGEGGPGRQHDVRVQKNARCCRRGHDSLDSALDGERRQIVLHKRATHRPLLLSMVLILRRHGVPRLAICDPMTGEVIRASKTTAVRYERYRPGELVHMDVKKIGRIPDGGGWRARGREMGSSSARKKIRVGYDFVHSVVDDHSRFAYSEILNDEQASTTAAFFERAVTCFAEHGTRVDAVMTDNAWNYTHSNALRRLLDSSGIDHVLIKPHCPWQNGKVERFNRTLQTEWAYRHRLQSNDERTAALAPWLEHYNTRRRHTALGGHPPISRLSPT